MMDKCIECKGPLKLIAVGLEDNKKHLMSFYCSKCEIIYKIDVKIHLIKKKIEK